MTISDSLLDLIQQELFSYFQEHDYQFTIKKDDRYSRLTAVHNLQLDAYAKEYASFDNISRFPLFKEYIKRGQNLDLYKNPTLKADPFIHHQFFISFFKKYPLHRKELVQHYSTICSFNWSDDLCLDTFLDECSTNFKDATQLIDSFPIQLWNISVLSPSKLVTILEKKGGTAQEIDDFLFHFYSDRKEYMDNSRDGPIIRDFLLQRHNYDEDKLKAYFPFFNFLNVYFHTPEPDIFEIDFSFTTSTIINLTRIKNVFSIDKFNSFEYELSLVTLCNTLVQYYDLTSVSFYDADKGNIKTQHTSLQLSNCKEIVFSHSNSDFTKTLLDKTIIQFLNFLKHNYDYVIDDKNVLAWVAQNKLNDDLSSTNTKIKRQKI